MANIKLSILITTATINTPKLFEKITQKNNVIYIANERKNKVMAFKYTITKIER